MNSHRQESDLSPTFSDCEETGWSRTPDFHRLTVCFAIPKLLSEAVAVAPLLREFEVMRIRTFEF